KLDRVFYHARPRPRTSGDGLRVVTFRVLGKDDPDVGPGVPRPAAIVAEQCSDLEPSSLETARHLGHGERSEGQRESMDVPASTPTLGELLGEDRQPECA